MKIRELLTDESKWTKEVVARNADGDPVDFNDINAVCWCLLGAVAYCYDNQYHEIIERMRMRTGWPSIGSFNDQALFEQIRNLIEELDI